jgi:hypothetical protein
MDMTPSQLSTKYYLPEIRLEVPVRDPRVNLTTRAGVRQIQLYIFIWPPIHVDNPFLTSDMAN